jgi:beta-glucosidase
MMMNSRAVPRLGIPEYDWWNEALHGVARAGLATVFPQAIGMAATWNEPEHLKTFEIISDEARAKYNQFVREGKRGRYQGISFWTPNINIFRDPRWGRGQETYGEDPYLTTRLGIAAVKGLQGDHPFITRPMPAPSILPSIVAPNGTGIHTMRWSPDAIYGKPISPLSKRLSVKPMFAK